VNPSALSNYTDADFRSTMLGALRLEAGAAFFAALLVGWRFGWASAALLLVGALISGSGLWEWLLLMTAVMDRMDKGDAARPMGPVLVGFFLRLGLTVAVLYASLKALHGSVFALAAGLGLGVICLTAEVLRRLNR
jgi:hypothetical protein